MGWIFFLQLRLNTLLAILVWTGGSCLQKLEERHTKLFWSLKICAKNSVILMGLLWYVTWCLFLAASYIVFAVNNSCLIMMWQEVQAWCIGVLDTSSVWIDGSVPGFHWKCLLCIWKGVLHPLLHLWFLYFIFSQCPQWLESPARIFSLILLCLVPYLQARMCCPSILLILLVRLSVELLIWLIELCIPSNLPRFSSVFLCPAKFLFHIMFLIQFRCLCLLRSSFYAWRRERTSWTVDSCISYGLCWY